MSKYANFNHASPDVFNAIRNNASAEYRSRVPIATQKNFKDVSTAIMSFEPNANEYLNALVNRIGMTIITSKIYENPLKPFKKGTLEFGETVQEVYVNLIKAKEFSFTGDVDHPGKKNIPDVRSAYHQVNNQKQYATTIMYDALRAAFLSENGLNSLVDGIYQSLTTSFEYDEFTEIKLLLVEQAKKGIIKPVTIPTLEKENANAIARILKEHSNNLRFMSPVYNSEGVPNFTKVEDQYLIMTSKFSAMFDVDVLANAFNMDKTQFLGNQVLVDNFLDLHGVEAMLIDRDFLMIFDNILKLTDHFSPNGLYWNYWLTSTQTFSVSPFVNAIMFTTTPQTTFNTDPIEGSPNVDIWSRQQAVWSNGTVSKAELGSVSDLSIDVKMDNDIYREGADTSIGARGVVYGVDIKANNGDVVFTNIVPHVSGETKVSVPVDKGILMNANLGGYKAVPKVMLHNNDGVLLETKVGASRDFTLTD